MTDRLAETRRQIDDKHSNEEKKDANLWKGSAREREREKKKEYRHAAGKNVYMCEGKLKIGI